MIVMRVVCCWLCLMPLAWAETTRTVLNADPRQLEQEILRLPDFPKRGISVYRITGSDAVWLYIDRTLTAPQLTALDALLAAHVPVIPAVTTVADCGLNPSIDGTDRAGHVTVGRGVVTSCTIHFAAPTDRRPVCIGGPESFAAPLRVSASSQTSVTFSTVQSMSEELFGYQCVVPDNGRGERTRGRGGRP